MTVFVVLCYSGAVSVAGVFSTLEKASAYVKSYSHSAYIIVERRVDAVEVLANAET